METKKQVSKILSGSYKHYEGKKYVRVVRKVLSKEVMFEPRLK
jgi:hypothetical protein